MAKIDLTIRQIMDLATFAGFSIDENHGFEDDELDETLICIDDCPTSGVGGDDGESPLFYDYIAYFEDCPEEGVFGLGNQYPPHMTTN